MEDLSFSDASLRMPYQSPAQQSPPTRKSRKRFYVLLAVIVLALIIFFGRSAFLGSQKQAPTPTPTPEFQFPTDTPVPTEATSPTPDVTEAPTPKPTSNPVDKATGLDRSDLSVEVQNGSGTVGAASKASEVLKSFGYHVVSTGNAGSFDYTATVIQVKSGKSSYLTFLKKDLSTSYTIGATTSDLSASSSADALVIVGKE